MGKLATDVFDARARRNVARRGFDARLEQIRADLEARGVAGRIADKASADVREAIDEAVDVASESKGVIAGAIAALAIWFFRNPILARLEAMLGDESETGTEGSLTHDRE